MFGYFQNNSENFTLKITALVDISWKPTINKTCQNFWIPHWLSDWPFSHRQPLSVYKDDFLKPLIKWLVHVSSSLYLWLNAFYNISDVAYKGISHKGFSRFKRTVKYLENQHMNVWTQLEIISNENFKRIQEFALFPPYALLVPCIGC